MFNIDPDKIQTRIQRFVDENAFNELFQFIALYIHRSYSNAHLQRSMKRFVNRSFLEMITPSDIAYVLALIKNSQGV